LVTLSPLTSLLLLEVGVVVVHPQIFMAVEVVAQVDIGHPQEPRVVGLRLKIR
jgi:hypothetical protein